MAFFGVTVEKIKTLKPITGADRIEEAVLDGIDFSFVVAKNKFKVGDQCIYIPLDSVVPHDIQTKLGIAGKLDSKNRIRTVRLKGVYSEGVAEHLSFIQPLLDVNPFPTSQEITDHLNITKYEPPEVGEENQKASVFRQTSPNQWPWYRRMSQKYLGETITRRLFGKAPNELIPLTHLGVPVYDIEGCNRYPKVVEQLMDEPVWITLKIEGQNAAVHYKQSKWWFLPDYVGVNQRRYAVTFNKHNHLWKIAESHDFTGFAKYLGKKYKKEILVYFEAAGSDNGANAITGNIYKWNQHKGFVFDIKVGDRFLNMPEMIAEYNRYFSEDTSKLVPFVCYGLTLREWLASRGYDSVEDAAAKTMDILHKTDDKLEEGIVIHPQTESYCHALQGCTILKYRSKPYKVIYH